ncbi:uncharacterized protein LOC132741210 isoform X4 [Ruditapes philippinarum]|uniref:uncharacterized protein LOC132741210 isoform X4 n=1 Tax=Ruditapes philippinarum TaxID=129788 RepID=UPI00295B1DAB|nr:uncharacterized protein LOC132741210 isoform X4 [Ruditapes philippinarum]
MRKMADKYYRLVCFVVDICADVLRKYFIKLARTEAGSTYTSIDAYLSQRNRDVMQLFNNKKLRRDQYDLLYPGNSTADENQWDVSILVTLITELFATRLQPVEIFALKTEIRGIRNELQHNPNTGNISDDDFDDYWGRLDSSVRLIATNALDTNDQASLLEKINQVKCNHLPNLSDCQRLWHEETIKQMFNILDEVQANTSILRQVTVQKPGPSGDKNKRIKVADDILARLQAGFESTMKELSGDFNPPSEVTDIRAKLRDGHHVVVTGCNNSRYFETALAAIKGMDYNYKRCVEMHTSSDWRHIDPEDVDLVLCRDPFGRISYDESKAKAMDDIFKSMMHSTKRDSSDKALDIVIVTDLKIFEECKMHHDHELLDEVVKVFTDTSSTQPADLTIAMTKHFLMVYKISSRQVDDQILKNAKKSFKANKAIVLTGHEKCGKTSIAVALASAYEEQQCLLLKKPNDVNYIDFPNTCLVIIDEFAGKYRYEENEVYKWYNMFDYLYNAVIAEPINVIITCEKSKLDKCINEVRRHAILEHVVDVSLQKAVVKSEVPEEYGHISGKIVTTDHSIGTISNTTQTLNYTASLLGDPSQGPIPLSRHDTIPVSTRNTSIFGLEYGHVSFVNIDHSIGTISNTTQSKNYPLPLPEVPSQWPILLSSPERIPLSTGNTSYFGRTQLEGIQNPMQLKRGFPGMERVIQTETADLSVKRSRSMSSGLWSVKEKREINIRTYADSQDCNIKGSCILPLGEILLADYNNNNLKKLDDMYNVKCVCDLPGMPYDVCYVGDNVAVVSQFAGKLHFVDTKHSMTLDRSIDTDHTCHGLACHGDQIYVRDCYGSVYRYSTDGIKQQMIYSSRNLYNIFNNTSISVSIDGSKLYLPCENELVTIDNNGNHWFILNNLDIVSSGGVCVDDQGFVYVTDSNGNFLQISEDGRTILQVITNISGWKCALLRTLTFDRRNKALIAAGYSDTIQLQRGLTSVV